MDLSTTKFYLLFSVVLILPNLTPGEKNENNNINEFEEKDHYIEEDQEEEKPLEKDLSERETVKEEKSSENDPSSDEPEPSVEENEEALKDITNSFLSKLDGDLKKKVESKIEDLNFSISPSFFDEFSNDEQERLKTALTEVFAPFFSQMLQQLSGFGITPNSFSIKDSTIANLSSEEVKDNEPTKKDEL